MVLFWEQFGAKSVKEAAKIAKLVAKLEDEELDPPLEDKAREDLQKQVDKFNRKSGPKLKNQEEWDEIFDEVRYHLMNFALKNMHFVFKMMNSVLNLMNSALDRGLHRWRRGGICGGDGGDRGQGSGAVGADSRPRAEA